MAAKKKLTKGGRKTTSSKSADISTKVLPQTWQEAEAQLEFQNTPGKQGDFELVDKKELVGKPFVVINWEFRDGEFGGQYASVYLITKDNERLVFNDGSTGVRAQLEEAEEGKGIICKRGLRVSDYSYEDKKGNEIPASTYYLT